METDEESPNPELMQLIERIEQNDPTCVKVNVSAQFVENPELLDPFFKALKNNTHIQHLDLSNNQLEHAHVIALKKLIEDMNSLSELRTLNLTGNKLRPMSFMTLISTLSKFPKAIQSVDMIVGNSPNPLNLKEVAALSKKLDLRAHLFRIPKTQRRTARLLTWMSKQPENKWAELPLEVICRILWHLPEDHDAMVDWSRPSLL